MGSVMISAAFFVMAFENTSSSLIFNDCRRRGMVGGRRNYLMHNKDDAILLQKTANAMAAIGTQPDGDFTVRDILTLHLTASFSPLHSWTLMIFDYLVY